MENKFSVKYTEIIENVFPVLVSEKALEETPSLVNKAFLDCHKAYAILLKKDGLNAKALVKKSNLEQLKMNEKELDKLAEINLRRLPASMIPMGQFLEPDYGPQEDGPLYVLRTTDFYGANVLLKEDVLNKAAEQMGGSMFIIPSSVHEVIVLPKDVTSAEALEEMIRNVNEAEVAPEEQLSDHLYAYEPGKGLSLAREEATK